LAAELEVPEADEDACRRYFEANRDRFRSPEEIELRHILLAAAPDDAGARMQQRDAGEELLAKLEENPESFVELAQRHSDCPSAENGGHLGVIGRGQTVPELEQVVLRLPVGLAERPVETRYGFHIVEVLHRTGGDPLAYQQVRHLIAEYLHERSWRRAVSQYIGRLASDAEIKGVDVEAAESPLIQ
jgi:peptidyl-prolyl cis-trans isomerase C